MSNSTLLLDTVLWDLCLNASGHIAVASDPYATAQMAACAVRLFQGELFYATNKGVPYFSTILGLNPPMQQVKNELITAAKTVPGVTSAKVYLNGVKDRSLTGQLQLFNESNDLIGATNF